jgi:hypothetical protein
LFEKKERFKAEKEGVFYGNNKRSNIPGNECDQ